MEAETRQIIQQPRNATAAGSWKKQGADTPLEPAEGPSSDGSLSLAW